MDKETAQAIGLYCKQCQVFVDIHFVYLDNRQMYLQGPCPECGEDVRFNADDLLVHLLEHPGNQGGNKGVQ